MAEIRPSGRVRLSALAEGSDRYKKLKGFPTKIGKPLFDGRDGEIRTRDLTHPKRARYQAAPRPENYLKYVCVESFVKRREWVDYFREFFASASSNPSNSINSEAIRFRAARPSGGLYPVPSAVC